MHMENIKYVLTKKYSGNQIVAIIDGEEVGLLNYVFRQNKCLLLVISVKENFRGRGISSHLLKILENDAIDNNINYIEGRYCPTSDNAKFMYDRFGYSITRDNYQDYVYKHGLSYYDDVKVEIIDNTFCIDDV